MLESIEEEVSNYEVDSNVEDTLRTSIFEVKSVPLHYLRTPGSYQNDLGEKALPYISG